MIQFIFIEKSSLDNSQQEWLNQEIDKRITIKNNEIESINFEMFMEENQTFSRKVFL
ncbi:MAG: hypothetical protein AB8G11_11360 [Saprospiraceae bacterium]